MDGDEGLMVGVMLRALRRRADVSQRELAALSGVAQSLIARIESGAVFNPGIRTVERLLRSAGGELTVQLSGDHAARALVPVPHEDLRDRAERHLPAHLDAEVLVRPEFWRGAWWASSMVRERWPLDTVPPCTFDRRRGVRDERRARAARGAAAAIVRSTRPGELRWTARLDDGSVVGELRAHEFDDRVDGVSLLRDVTVRPGTVVLDGVVVAEQWRRLGVGRRLVEALRKEATATVVTLAAGLGMQHFLKVCGFEETRGLRAPQWLIA